MRAMILSAQGEPLRDMQLPDPRPSPGQVLIRVQACAVCRTDLHVFDGDLPEPKLPLILGHEIVGTELGNCYNPIWRWSIYFRTLPIYVLVEETRRAQPGRW